MASHCGHGSAARSSWPTRSPFCCRAPEPRPPPDTAPPAGPPTSRWSKRHGVPEASTRARSRSSPNRSLSCPLAPPTTSPRPPPSTGGTAPQLREWLRRRVIAANPDAAEERRQRAMADRRVVITPGDDGLSELWALLPSVQARQIQQGLTAAAHDAGADDGRSMDQRRADSLVDLLLGRSEPQAVKVHLIVDADTVAGDRHHPGWVPGIGPITAEEAAELIEPAQTSGSGAQVAFRRLLTHPTTGFLTDITEKQYRPSAALDRAVRARDVTCRFPGCRRSADSAGTDLDHTIPRAPQP
jgi:hypothetical protein